MPDTLEAEPVLAFGPSTRESRDLRPASVTLDGNGCITSFQGKILGDPGFRNRPPNRTLPAGAARSTLSVHGKSVCNAGIFPADAHERRASHGRNCRTRVHRDYRTRTDDVGIAIDFESHLDA